MQNPFTADCPDFLPAAYHSRIRWLPYAVLGVGGILSSFAIFLWGFQLLVDFFAYRVRMAETFASGTGWLVLGMVLEGLCISASVAWLSIWPQLTNAIFLCRTGKHIYLTRFVFLRKRSRDQGYDLHGGQTYDFWKARKDHLSTFDVARDYLSALDALRRKIQEGDIADDAEIAAETWFFQKKNIVRRLEKTGFKRAPSKERRWKFWFFKWNIWLKHLLIGGDWRNLPDIRHVSRYEALAKYIRTIPDART